MNSNQIAETLSKGKPVQFWLTRKQASWLLEVALREGATVRFNRIHANGEFLNLNGNFRWECHEGYNGSALLKVFEVKEVVEPKNDFAEFVSSKGYDIHELVRTNNPIAYQLAVEWGQQIKK